MLQRLPIALAQIKAGNTSENLLNEIIQIIYSLCQAKRNYKRKDKHVALSNLSIYYTWKNIKKCKISAPTWNEEFELPDGSYSV